jgi:hypothetical protein
MIPEVYRLPLGGRKRSTIIRLATNKRVMS